MKVPFLATLDLEIAPDHDLDMQFRILERIQRDLRTLRLPITIFATAEAAERFAEPLAALLDDGHALGCHGLNHNPDEHFGRLPHRTAREVLTEATGRIEAALGRRPLYFRGPCMTTSAATQRTLVDLGYRADFSVCSQRLDFLKARGGSIGWLVAPRRPYHPHCRNAFRPGDGSIWVVPMRCLGVPFQSGLLYLARGLPARLLFALLLFEARRRGGPLVYLLHSYEFTRFQPGSPDRRPLAQRMYIQDATSRYERNRSFLRRITALPCIQPFSADVWLGEVGAE